MMVVMVVVLGLVMVVMVMCDGVGDTGHDGGGDEWLVSMVMVMVVIVLVVMVAAVKIHALSAERAGL